MILWQDVTCGKQKLKHSFPGELEHTSENWDRHEGELGHATIALFAIPMFCESICIIILKYQQKVPDNDFTFRIFIKAQE